MKNSIKTLVRNKTLWSIILILGISLFVHWRWIFTNSLFVSGDFRFYYNETSINFFKLPSIWVEHQIYIPALGAFNLLISFSQLLFIQGVLAKLGLSYEIIERVMYFYPITIIAPISIFLLIKKILKSNTAAIVGSLLYNYNTYALNYHRDFMNILVADIIAPLGLLLLIYTLEKKKYYLSILTGLIIYIISIFEFRIFYIESCILILYFLYYLFIINNNFTLRNLSKYLSYIVVIFLIPLLFNLYWILPLFVTHSIANNPIIDRGIINDNPDSTNILFSIAFFHPSWTGSEMTFFVNKNVMPYFWIIPITVFIGLYMKRKDKNIIFFGFLSIIGILLMKVLDTPFANFYLYLYKYLPGFIAFREPSKFWIILALGYSILIGSFTKKLVSYISTKNILRSVISIFIVITLCILSFSILYNTTSLIDGSFKANFVPVKLDYDALKLKDFLNNDTEFSRVAWINNADINYSFYSNTHPMIDLKQMTIVDWKLINNFRENNTNVDYMLLSYLNQPYVNQLLNESSVKYIIVDNIPFYREKLDKMTNLKAIKLPIDKYIVYQNLNYHSDEYIQAKNQNQYENSKIHYDSLYEDYSKYKSDINILNDSNWNLRSKTCDSTIYNSYTDWSGQKLQPNTQGSCKFIDLDVEKLGSYIFQFSGFNDVDRVEYTGIFNDSNSTTFYNSRVGKINDFITIPPEANKLKLILYTSNPNIEGNFSNFSLNPVKNTLINDNYSHIDYKNNSETEKTGTIKNITQSQYILMNEQYDPKWELQIQVPSTGKYIKLDDKYHSIYNISFNSWYIDINSICQNTNNCSKNSDGSYNLKFIIDYTNQLNTNLGTFIGIGGLILLIPLLFITYKKKI